MDCCSGPPTAEYCMEACVPLNEINGTRYIVRTNHCEDYSSTSDGLHTVVEVVPGIIARTSSYTAKNNRGGQASRPISTVWLKVSLPVHRPPINLVVYQEP